MNNHSILEQYTKELAEFRQQCPQRSLPVPPYGDLVFSESTPPNPRGSTVLLFCGTASVQRTMFRLQKALYDRGIASISVDWPPVGDHTALLSVVVSFIEQRKLRRVNVFGVSMGAFFATLFAAVHTDMVDSLLVVDPVSSTLELAISVPAPLLAAKKSAAWALRAALRRSCRTHRQRQAKDALAAPGEDAAGVVVEQLSEKLSNAGLRSKFGLQSELIGISDIGISYSKVLVITTPAFRARPAYTDTGVLFNLGDETGVEIECGTEIRLSKNGVFCFISMAQEIAQFMADFIIERSAQLNVPAKAQEQRSGLGAAMLAQKAAFAFDSESEGEDEGESDAIDQI